MMKRLSFALAVMATLALPAGYASNLMSPHRLAVIGGTRPTLVSETGSFDGTATDSRTVAINPPVGTSLLIVYAAAMRKETNSNFDFGAITFNGTAMSQLTGFSSSDRVIDGFAYRLNPASGSQNLVFTLGGTADWNGTIIYAWMFSGTDPSDPFGQQATEFNVSATSLSTSFQPEYGRPYILAGSAASKSAGGGNCYEGTNLTIAAQGRDDTDDIFAAAAANATLTGALETTFTMNCVSSGTGHISLEMVEIKGP